MDYKNKPFLAAEKLKNLNKDHSIEQISEKTGIPSSTVKTLLKSKFLTVSIKNFSIENEITFAQLNSRAQGKKILRLKNDEIKKLNLKKFKEILGGEAAKKSVSLLSNVRKLEDKKEQVQELEPVSLVAAEAGGGSKVISFPLERRSSIKEMTTKSHDETLAKAPSEKAEFVSEKGPEMEIKYHATSHLSSFKSALDAFMHEQIESLSMNSIFIKLLSLAIIGLTINRLGGQGLDIVLSFVLVDMIFLFSWAMKPSWPTYVARAFFSVMVVISVTAQPVMDLFNARVKDSLVSEGAKSGDDVVSRDIKDNLLKSAVQDIEDLKKSLQLFQANEHPAQLAYSKALQSSESWISKMKEPPYGYIHPEKAKGGSLYAPYKLELEKTKASLDSLDLEERYQLAKDRVKEIQSLRVSEFSAQEKIASKSGWHEVLMSQGLSVFLSLALVLGVILLSIEKNLRSRSA